MLAKSKQEFIILFQEIDDYRQDEKVLYPLDEILFLLFTGVLGCAESWDLIIEYSKRKIDFLRKYFPYKHGIPSKSTLITVIGMINKAKFEQWFSNWANDLADLIPQELIAIDGKTIRGSRNSSKKASHVLNAYEENDKGHGRVEIRKCWSTNAPDWFKNQGWASLKSISMIESERIIKGKNSIEQRIYISSLASDAKQHFNYARQHWLVENNVHWFLDVIFKEDDSQIKNAAENMSIIRKIIINLIRIYKEKIQTKSSLKALRMMAGWSEDVAGGILQGLCV